MFQTSWKVGSFVLIAGAIATSGGLAATGCGGDDDTGGTGAGGSTSTSTTTTGSGGGGTCGPGMVNQNDPCEVCAADKCMAESLACCEAEGCLDVIACVRETGCNADAPLDPGGCYTPEMCQAEIDAATLPVAQGQAKALGDCAQSKCPAECGTGSGGGGTGGGGTGGAGGN